MKFLKVLLGFGLLFTSNLLFSATGCIYGNSIYTSQLPNVSVYRSPYYSQEYENWSNATINTNDIAYYKDPNKCNMYDYSSIYLSDTEARRNGCLINGNPGQVGRVIQYSISNYCSLPLDDCVFPLLLIAGSSGFFYLAKYNRT